MNELFPGKKRFTIKGPGGELVSQHVGMGLDWKAKVVCESCNNGWMSDIETQHAKPSMTDLILGKPNTPIGQSRATSIAIFAFKTAVILNHMHRRVEPFFRPSVRHRFRQHLAIPGNVTMWMAGFSPSKGEVQTWYSDGKLSPANSIELYTCTYAVGHFVFQVVGQWQNRLTAFRPHDAAFDRIAVPFWPAGLLPQNLRWPTDHILRSVDDFDGFAIRWKAVQPYG
jgi:hypothetical protein